MSDHLTKYDLEEHLRKKLDKIPEVLENILSKKLLFTQRLSGKDLNQEFYCRPFKNITDLEFCFGYKFEDTDGIGHIKIYLTNAGNTIQYLDFLINDPSNSFEIDGAIEKAANSLHDIFS